MHDKLFEILSDFINETNPNWEKERNHQEKKREAKSERAKGRGRGTRKTESDTERTSGKRKRDFTEGKGKELLLDAREKAEDIKSTERKDKEKADEKLGSADKNMKSLEEFIQVEKVRLPYLFPLTISLLSLLRSPLSLLSESLSPKESAREDNAQIYQKITSLLFEGGVNVGFTSLQKERLLDLSIALLFIDNLSPSLYLVTLYLLATLSHDSTLSRQLASKKLITRVLKITLKSFTEKRKAELAVTHIFRNILLNKSVMISRMNECIIESLNVRIYQNFRGI